MVDYEYDLAVVGAGIIGLAVGMRLTQDYPSLKVAVIEKESEVALHQTGHIVALSMLVFTTLQDLRRQIFAPLEVSCLEIFAIVLAFIMTCAEN